MFLTIFSSFLFYLFPILIGALLIRNKYFFFPIGVLTTYILFFLGFQLQNIFPQLSYASSLKYLLFGISGISLFLLPIFYFKHLKSAFTKSKTKIYLSIATIIVSSSLLFFGLWKETTPFPLQLNWDIYEHITVANKITSGSHSILPSFISDTFTFNGYTTLFHSLLATTIIPFNTNLIENYWFIEYWHFLFLLIVTFFFFRSIQKSVIFALFSTIITSLIFESSIVYTNLFLIPQTFAATLFIILSCYVIKEKPITIDLKAKNKISFNGLRNTFLFGISLFTLFISHFVIGTFAIGMIGLMILLQNFSVKHLKLISNLLIILVIATLITSAFFSVAITGREEANYFNLSLEQKILLLIDWYGLLFFPLFIGAIFTYIKSKDKTELLLLALALFGFAISLAPFSYFTKFYVVARLFINAVSLLFLFNILQVFKHAKYVLYFFFLGILLLTFILSQLNYKNIITYNNKATHFSFEELNAANWLKENTTKKDFIISDPSTQYVLEGLSQTNSQGGAYMSEDTRNILITLEHESNPDIFYQRLSEIKDLNNNENDPTRTVYFIFSQRYLSWQKLPDEQQKSFFYNIWSPRDFDQKELSEKLPIFNSKNFTLVFQNNQLRIYKLQ